MRLLLAYGADPTLRDSFGSCAFDKCTLLSVFETLLGVKRGEQDEVQGPGSGMEALFPGTAVNCGLWSACESGRVDFVQAALHAGANVNCADSKGKTVLMVACARNHLGVVKALLDWPGINVNACTSAQEPRSALLYAAKRGNDKVVRMLVKHASKHVAKGGALLFCDRALEIAREKQLKDVEAALTEKPKGSASVKPLEFVTALLQNDADVAPFLQMLPKKWHLIGRVAMLQNVEQKLACADRAVLAKIGEAYLKCPQIKAESIVLETEPPHGELRTPTVVVIAGSHDTLTKHLEDGVSYFIDPTLVMFASGNGTERMHFKRNIVCGAEDVVVDMFAGIGYFTVPLALSPHRPKRIFALEKNPNSARFLRQNVETNGVGNVVQVCEGDNREVGNEAVGKASRVLMGYIPTPEQFIHRALQFLRPNEGGTLHYHYTATKEQMDSTPAAHIEPKLAEFGFCISKVTVRKIKNYGPHTLHYVADVEIIPKKA